MGKKGGWFSAVKRALSHDHKEKKKKGQRSQRSKKKWTWKNGTADGISSSTEEETALTISAPAPPLLIDDAKLTNAETEQSKHAYSVALASAVAAEAAVAAAQAAAEVVRLTSVSRISGKTKEEVAAIRIQTAFRGYMARRGLRALRGLVRLKRLIQGQYVKRQAATTLRCMQTLARVQSQIRARRLRMSEDNQALQRQLQKKHEIEIEKLKLGGDWNDSTQSKEQIESRLLNRQEAAVRRERALAYAFSHQKAMKNKSANPTFMDPNNPTWGWSWLERWMAARPWESQATTMENSDRASLKSRAMSIAGGEINRNRASYSPTTSSNKPSNRRLSSYHSPSSTPTNSRVHPSVGKGKTFSPSSKVGSVEDDNRSSSFSVQSEKQLLLYRRRHSVAGSSSNTRGGEDDDESQTSFSSVPSYMAPTKSTKARSRLPSPLGQESKDERVNLIGGSPSARKRLSFQGSSPVGPRRHSGPPMAVQQH